MIKKAFKIGFAATAILIIGVWGIDAAFYPGLIEIIAEQFEQNVMELVALVFTLTMIFSIIALFKQVEKASCPICEPDTQTPLHKILERITIDDHYENVKRKAWRVSSKTNWCSHHEELYDALRYNDELRFAVEFWEENDPGKIKMKFIKLALHLPTKTKKHVDKQITFNNL